MENSPFIDVFCLMIDLLLKLVISYEENFYLPQGPQSASGPGAQGTKGMALPIENHETNGRKHKKNHRTTLEIKKKQENYIYNYIYI